MTTTAAPSNVESLLQRMVRFDTVNAIVHGKPAPEEPLARDLEQVARGMGLETRKLPITAPGVNSGGNLLVSHKVGDDRPWLLFESHMDTVNVEGMIVEPFAATIRDGKLWGRGSCDTKGTGASMLWALSQYAKKPAAQKHNNIAIAYTVDEEYGMTGVLALVREHLPALGFKPRGVIVGEPTRFRPIIAHNGCVRWRIITHGVAAHSSNPSRGRSAIRDMMRVLDVIESRYIPSLDAHDPLTGKAQASVNIIKGGNQINIIPAHCEVHIDRRVAPGENAALVLPTVERLLDELRRADPGMKVEIDPIITTPPLTTRHNAALLTAVQGVLTSMNLPTAPCGEPYATDAGCLDLAGIPSIVIGPGDVLQAHTKDEFIELDQLRRGVDFYLALMQAKV